MSVTLPRLGPRFVLLLVVVAAISAFFVFGGQRLLSLDALRSNEQALMAIKQGNPVLFAAGYLALYIGLAAFAVPGALVLTLAGGALFGLVEGIVLASFGSSIGATLALLASRFLFRGLVRRHFSDRLNEINRGLERDGWLYLVSLRLVPVIPFFVVDVLFGMTDFPVRRFYAVSQMAMLPATVVYVNAGTQLVSLHSASDVLSPRLLGSLVLLACLPLLARWGIRWNQRRIKRG